MYLIILLVVIPVLCIGLTVYFMSLVTFATTGDLDIIMLFGGMAINSIIIYFLPRLLIICLDDWPILLNRKKYFNNIHSYIILIFCVIFAVCLIIQSINIKFNLLHIIIAFIIIACFIYITIRKAVCIKVHKFKLGAIIEVKRGLSRLVFMDELENVYEYYLTNTNRYRIDKEYACKFNIKTKRIYKVINEIEGAINE